MCPGIPVSHQGIEGLQRVVADTDVDEILLHELADTRHVGIAGLLVQHGPAVTARATGPSALRGGKEQPRAPALARGQRAVVPGEEAIERRVASEDRKSVV